MTKVVILHREREISHGITAVSYTHLDVYKRQVQQPNDEPEVIPQEVQPELSQPEKQISTGETAFREWLKQMMESMNKKMDETSQSTKEELATINRKIEDGQRSTKEENRKNIESLKEDNRSLKEELNNKIEETSQSTNQKIGRTIEENRKFGEKLRREREQSNPKIDDNRMEVEKVPEDKNMEQASPEPCLLYTSRCV